MEAFGVDSVHVELWDHGDPLDSHRNDALSELALRRGVGGGGHQPRAPRHPGRESPGRGAGRGGGPAKSRRCRWLVTGRIREPTCGQGPSRTAASPAIPG